MKARLALLVLACCDPSAAADPRDPILAGWEASRGRVLTVRYTLSGSIEAKGDASGGGKNPTPLPVGAPPPFKATVLLDIPQRRHRLEDTVPTLSYRDKTKYTSRSRVWVCGGAVSKSLHPRDRNEHDPGDPDMHVSSGDMRTVRFDARYYPLFMAHGFIPSSREGMSPGHWPAPSDREEFVTPGTGVIGGRTHTILRGDPWHGFVDEYWADSGRGGAVGRLIIWADKSDPYMRWDAEHQQVGGVWVPKRWTHTVTMNKRVVQVERFQVDRVDLNPVVSDADFDIPVQPGYVVQEHVYPPKGSGLNPAYPASTTTRVKPDGRRETTEGTGFQTFEGMPVSHTRPWWGRWWVWAAGGVVTGLALMVAVHRRRHRCRPEREPASLTGG